MSDTKKMTVYRAKDGWRWHELTSSDFTAESGEAYENKQDAIDQAETHKQEGYELVVVDENESPIEAEDA